MAFDRGAGSSPKTEELSRTDMTALRRMLVMRRELPADPAWLLAAPLALATMWRRAQIMFFIIVPALGLCAVYQAYSASNGDHLAAFWAVVCALLAVVLLITALRIRRAVTQMRERLTTGS